MKFIQNWTSMIPFVSAFITGCMHQSDEGGSAGAKVFLALGICLGAVFLVFYIVAKGREKD